MEQIIAYFRVSTARQGASGLGLAAQEAAVNAYVARRGCQLLSSYEEIESGKRSDRPELAKALAHARRSRAVLCVAKLDRLARNMAFLAALMDAGVDFVALDAEHANRLTLHILAAVAEGEAKAISDRTKTALQAAKARGQLLGSSRDGHWRGREAARARGAAKAAAAAGKAHRQGADEAYSDLVPEMRRMRDEGRSYQEIAAALTEAGHCTRRGCEWNAVQVMRVLNRMSTKAPATRVEG